MDDSHSDLPLFSRMATSSSIETESPSSLHPTTSLSAAINAWGEALEDQGKSIHTVKAFTSDLRLLAKFVGSGRAINDISTIDIKNFLDWMLNKRGVPCSPKTYARRITSIKSFFRWLKEIGVLTEDPAAAVPQQSVLSPLPSVLNDDEVKSVLKTAGASRNHEKADARPYTLLSLLLETAIKKGECLAIHINHIDPKSVDGPILFVRYGDVKKRYKERKLSLSQDWIEAYEEYLNQYKPTDRLFPWSPRRLEYILEDIGELAGLEKHISFDMCRWTSALTDYRVAIDPDKIRQKMGISKIQWREVRSKLQRLSEQSED